MDGMVRSQDAGELAGSSFSRLGASLSCGPGTGCSALCSASSPAACLRNATRLLTGGQSKRKLRWRYEAAY